MRSALGLLIVAAVALSGCDSTTTRNGNATPTPTPTPEIIVKTPDPIKPEGPVDPNFKACNPYFPLIPGAQYRYSLVYSSGLVADLRVVHSAKDENGQQVFTEKTQIVDTGGGQNKLEDTIKTFSCDGDRVRLLSWMTDTTIDGQRTQSRNEVRRESYAMIEPAALTRTGSQWSFVLYPFFKPGGSPNEIAGEPFPVTYEVKGIEDITVPAGKFKAVKVVQRVNKGETTLFFVKGLGLVSRITGEGSRLELKEYGGVTPID